MRHFFVVLFLTCVMTAPSPVDKPTTNPEPENCASLCQSILQQKKPSHKEPKEWEFAPIKWIKTFANSISKFFTGKNRIFPNLIVRTGVKSVPQKRRYCCFKPKSYQYPPRTPYTNAYSASRPRRESKDGCCFTFCCTYIPDDDGNGGELVVVGGGAMNHSHGGQRTTAAAGCCFSAHIDDSSTSTTTNSANPEGTFSTGNPCCCPCSAEDVINCAGATCSCIGSACSCVGQALGTCLEFMWNMSSGLIISCLKGAADCCLDP